MGNMLKNKDFVGAGFKRIPDNLIEQHPPMPKWGKAVLDMSLKDRCRYFERVAAAMNHAADRLQQDNTALNQLLADYKGKMESMARSTFSNNAMLQQMTTKHNADRQQMLQTIARQNAELRELRKKVAADGPE